MIGSKLRSILARRTALSLLLLVNCASYTSLAPDERGRIERELNVASSTKYLRLSYYVLPFFGDASKKLLSPLPPDEVRMLDRPDGTPIEPGPIERVVPVRTAVRILKVEFPTSWVLTTRMITTPRTRTWIYLRLENQSSYIPYIVVLGPEIKSEDEFQADLERYLSDRDPGYLMTNWSETIRNAVKEKRAIPEMSTDALEMAWGYPLRRRITFDQGLKREEWTYTDAKRVAHIEDGRVVKLEGARHLP